MKALLMAAGRGTRLSRSVHNIPKSTLTVNGKSLIRRTVEIMAAQGIPSAICVGYEKEHIFKVLEGLEVSYYTNPFFDVTNSIASLWMMREQLDDDVVLMNADVYFDNILLDMLINDPHETTMLVDRDRIKSGDYFFQTQNGIIVRYGKDLPLEERSCEYVGMAQVKKTFLPTFLSQMDELIGRQRHNAFWEDILYSMSGQTNIHTLDVNGHFWSEVDYLDDYERLLTHVASQGPSYE